MKDSLKYRNMVRAFRMNYWVAGEVYRATVASTPCEALLLCFAESLPALKS